MHKRRKSTAERTRNPDIGWCSYSRPLIDDEVLYAPSRMFESDVTTRYLDWWRWTVTCLVSPVKSMGKGCRSLRRPLQRSWKKLDFVSQNREVPVPRRQKKHRKKLAVNEAMQEFISQKIANDPEAPPGFPPKRRIKTTGQSSCAHNENGIYAWIESMGNLDEIEKNDVQQGKSNSRATKFKSMNKLLGSTSKCKQRKVPCALVGMKRFLK